MTIIIDTREQTPWAFPAWVATRRECLPAGDYSIEGSGWAIERKELNDYLGTISSGWERFLRELERMKDYPIRMVVVEGTLADCCFTMVNGRISAPNHNHPKLEPAFILSRTAQLLVRGVQVVFAGNADLAAAIAYHTFKKWEHYGKVTSDDNSGDGLSA